MKTKPLHMPLSLNGTSNLWTSQWPEKGAITLLALSMCILLFCTCSSHKLPSKKYSQYSYSCAASWHGDTLKMRIANPLKCPLRVWAMAKTAMNQQKLNEINPITLAPLQDTLIHLADLSPSKLVFTSRLGDVNSTVLPQPIAFPFPSQKTYHIIQGNNSQYTHNTSWSRYAVDFSLAINDTICAASDGVVVGVINQYTWGGKSAKWKPYGNFITLYHPQMGAFTQYVHLAYHGSFVTVGDSVYQGQPIGLSGYTGQTDTPHLHFNFLVPSANNDGLKSAPFQFINGFPSTALKKGQTVSTF